MLKQTHIRNTELQRLRILRDEMASAINYEKHQRLREQAEAEAISDYWFNYHRKASKAQRSTRILGNK